MPENRIIRSGMMTIVDGAPMYHERVSLDGQVVYRSSSPVKEQVEYEAAMFAAELGERLRILSAAQRATAAPTRSPTTQDADTLKPCPFCGATDVTPKPVSTSEEWLIDCGSCHGGVVGKNKNDAVEKWNRRAE